jgi:hypothetical protein
MTASSQQARRRADFATHQMYERIEPMKCWRRAWQTICTQIAAAAVRQLCFRIYRETSALPFARKNRRFTTVGRASRSASRFTNHAIKSTRRFRKLPGRQQGLKPRANRRKFYIRRTDISKTYHAVQRKAPAAHTANQRPGFIHRPPCRFRRQDFISSVGTPTAATP